MPIQNCATALKDAGHDVYIITNGNDYIKEKTKGFEEKYGITMVYTACGLTNEDAVRDPRGMCENPINTYMETWLPYMRETMKQVAPDIVVNDFFSVPGIITAKELGIPVVINVPGPVKMMPEFGMFVLPDMNEASTCCGIICMKKTCKVACFQMILPKLMKLNFRTGMAAQNQNVWMFNSFFGID